MAKIDGYLRSIEKLGASGAVLSSGQAVILRFPAGDRQATQVTTHDQIVAMVREIAPLDALAALDAGRSCQFEFVSAGVAYRAAATARPGSWSVQLDPALPVHGAGAAYAPPSPQPVVAEVVVATGEMDIERSQYDDLQSAATTGSNLLDDLIVTARQLKATDLLLCAGCIPLVRLAGELVPLRDRKAIPADFLEREIGVLAPPEHRESAVNGGWGTFIYSNNELRLRVTLSRDHQGVVAAMRFMVVEPVPPERLGIPESALAIFARRQGIALVCGNQGGGKTTALGAIVHWLNVNAARFIIDLAKPIETRHTQRKGLVSQREVGSDAESFAVGIQAGIRQSADVIVVGDVPDQGAAREIIAAAAAGVFVIAAVPGADVGSAFANLSALAAGEGPLERWNQALSSHFVGGLATALLRRSDGAGRVAAYEVVVGTPLIKQLLAAGKTALSAAAMTEADHIFMESAIDDAVRRGARP